MISLENAKRLKELGVEPKGGGGQGAQNWHSSVCFTCTNRPCGSYGMYPMPDCDDYEGEYGSGYLHTLSQLLEEVEGWHPNSISLTWHGCLWIFEAGYFSGFESPHDDDWDMVGKSPATPEDAVALALIDILKGEKQE